MAERIVFVSGHLDLTQAEFDEHYASKIAMLVAGGAGFVVGDAPGCDEMTQELLVRLGIHPSQVVVHHMFVKPRMYITPNDVPSAAKVQGSQPISGWFSTSGGYTSDDERDAAMTRCSTEDLVWIKPGREKSGTAKNPETAQGKRP